MKEDLRRAERIAAVLEKMRIVEELDFAAARRQFAERQADETGLVETIAAGTFADGRIWSLLARRLVNAAAATKTAAAAVDAKADTLRTALLRHNHAEHRAKDARLAAERAEAKSFLSDTIDQVAAAPTSSVRQGDPDTVDGT